MRFRSSGRRREVSNLRRAYGCRTGETCRSPLCTGCACSAGGGSRRGGADPRNPRTTYSFQPGGAFGLHSSCAARRAPGRPPGCHGRRYTHFLDRRSGGHASSDASRDRPRRVWAAGSRRGSFTRALFRHTARDRACKVRERGYCYYHHPGSCARWRGIWRMVVVE
jgi:hypothetical protein